MKPDDEDQPTVRSRLRDAGLSADSIDAHHHRGTLRLDGEPVTSLEQAAPRGSRVVIGPAN